MESNRRMEENEETRKTRHRGVPIKLPTDDLWDKRMRDEEEEEGQRKASRKIDGHLWSFEQTRWQRASQHC